MSKTNTNQPISIEQQLRESFEHLTPTEKKAAKTLLENYPMEGLDKIASWASKSSVSSPTILRLISKLNYQSFSDFQNDLRQELEEQLHSPLQRHQLTQNALPHSDNFTQAFVDAICNNVRKSLSDIPQQEIDDVVDLLIDDKRTIHLLGGRFSDSLAHYCHQHLHAIRSKVRQIEGQASVWPEHLLDIRRKDVLFVFDIRRYQPNVVRFAGEANKRGAVVILMTDQWRSPISKVARYVFSMKIQVPSEWDSAAASLSMLELILANLSRRYWKKTEKRISDLEKAKGLLMMSK